MGTANSKCFPKKSDAKDTHEEQYSKHDKAEQHETGETKTTEETTSEEIGHVAAAAAANTHFPG